MKLIQSQALAALCAVWSFCAAAGNLILVGDSTLAPRRPEQRIGSWGDSMSDRLQDGWQIVNAAISGRTVKTIQDSTTNGWSKALGAMRPGDFVIVQFGINDASPRKLVEIPAFKAELARMADTIRAKGATPVFCSPVTSGTYDKKTGRFQRNESRIRYGTAVAEIAAEKKVDFVDMTELTSDVLAPLDRVRGQDLYVGDSVKKGEKVFDTIHPSKAGAKLFGEAFVRNVQERKLAVAAVFRPLEAR